MQFSQSQAKATFLADEIYRCIFLNKNHIFWSKFLFKFVPKGVNWPKHQLQ